MASRVLWIKRSSCKGLVYGFVAVRSNRPRLEKQAQDNSETAICLLLRLEAWSRTLRLLKISSSV